MTSRSLSGQSDSVALADVVQEGSSELRDFWTLLKPNVMQLVVLTGWVGLYLAPARLHPLLAFTAILCIALGAGASAAINNWYDADIDREMARTRLRPTASGRIEPADALGTGVTLAILSVMTMGLAVNWAAAALLALTIAFYVFVYTMWLKRRTPQNIVIGGAAGALPPMIGWAAATGEIGLLPVLLFLIVFVWTPPHFWALALYRCGDYARAGVPMLPVVAGRDSTRRHILAYTLVLAPLAVTPAIWGGLGLLYGIGATLLGLGFVALAWRLWLDDSDRTAMLTFRYSLAYLLLLFMLMVIDHALGFGVAA
jgi:protoheme IX farnesyltransferase